MIIRSEWNGNRERREAGSFVGVLQSKASGRWELGILKDVLQRKWGWIHMINWVDIAGDSEKQNITLKVVTAFDKVTTVTPWPYGRNPLILIPLLLLQNYTNLWSKERYISTATEWGKEGQHFGNPSFHYLLIRFLKTDQHCMGIMPTSMVRFGFFEHIFVDLQVILANSIKNLRPVLKDSETELIKSHSWEIKDRF